MKKTPQRKDSNAKKQSNDFDPIFDIFTLRKKPVSIEYIENLALACVKSAVEDKADLTLNGFFIRRGITNNTTDLWQTKSPVFKEAMATRRKMIGDKRETGAIIKDPSKDYLRLNEQSVMRFMPMYSEEYARFREWEASLSKENEQVENKIVVIESFEEKKQD